VILSPASRLYSVSVSVLVIYVVVVVGGWGKPPVDETGKPLYGDVFGQNTGAEVEPVSCLDYSMSISLLQHAI